MYIDCDTHYFPVKFLEGISDQYPESPRVVRKGDEVKSVLPDGTLIKNQAPKGRWDLDVRVQQADFEGFDKHVLIPENRELLYTWDRDLGCELARRYNDAVAQDLAECAHPERYIGVGWVFLPDVEESCKELDRMVNQLGIKAVKFMGGFEDANLGAERLWPVYDKVCQLDIPILVHDTASDRQDHPNPALVGIEQLYLEADNNALPFLLAFPLPLHRGHGKPDPARRPQGVPRPPHLFRGGLGRLRALADEPPGHGPQRPQEARQGPQRVLQPDLGVGLRRGDFHPLRLRLLEGPQPHGG